MCPLGALGVLRLLPAGTSGSVRKADALSSRQHVQQQFPFAPAFVARPARRTPPQLITIQPPINSPLPPRRRPAGLLKPHVDLLLCETLATVTEGQAAGSAAAASGLPWWASWTVEDSEGCRLRSGESLQARRAARGSWGLAWKGACVCVCVCVSWGKGVCSVAAVAGGICLRDVRRHAMVSSSARLHV